MKTEELSLEDSCPQKGYSILLLTLGHFFSDFYGNFLPAILPIIIAQMGLSLTLSGILVMIYSITSSLLQPICGYYVDKSGYTWLILVTMIVSAVFITLTGIVHNQAVLYICVAAAGAGSSLFHPLASSLMGKLMSQGKGLAMSCFIGGGNLGYAVAPVVVLYFLTKFGLEYLPLMAVPAVIMTALYYHAGLHTIDLKIIKGKQAEQGERWYKSRPLLLLNVVMALRGWVQVSIGTFIPVLLTFAGESPAYAGQILSIYLVGNAVGALIMGYCGDRYSRKFCTMLTFLIGLPALYYFFHAYSQGVVSLFALVIAGAALQGAMPLSLIWAQDMLPDNAALASGMMLGLSYGLGGVGTAATAVFADHIGLANALIATVSLLLPALIATWFIPEKQRLAASDIVKSTA